MLWVVGCTHTQHLVVLFLLSRVLMFLTLHPEVIRFNTFHLPSRSSEKRSSGGVVGSFDKESHQIRAKKGQKRLFSCVVCFRLIYTRSDSIPARSWLQRPNTKCSSGEKISSLMKARWPKPHLSHSNSRLLQPQVAFTISGGVFDIVSGRPSVTL